MCYGTVLALSSSIADAEDWVQVGTGRTGSVIYIDRDTVKPLGTSLQVWVIVDHANDKSVPEQTSKDRLLVDCENETITVQASYLYAADGKTNQQLTFEKHEQAQTPVIPGSSGSFIFDAVCKK